MPLDWGFPFLAGIFWFLIPLTVVWFIALFIFNTLGILPIIYIFAFSKKKE